MAEAKTETKTEIPTIPLLINRDYWDDKGERIASGTVVEIPLTKEAIKVAMQGVESGALATVKE